MQDFPRDCRSLGLERVNIEPTHMKSHLSTFLAGALLVAVPVLTQAATKQDPAGQKPVASASAGKLVPVTEKDAAWAKKARQDYPLQVCVASDEKLGSMGKSPEYIYRVDGKPDRLVVLCCDGCEEDFMKEPAKYLKKLDVAAKNPPAGKNSGAAKKDAHADKH